MLISWLSIPPSCMSNPSATSKLVNGSLAVVRTFKFSQQLPWTPHISDVKASDTYSTFHSAKLSFEGLPYIKGKPKCCMTLQQCSRVRQRGAGLLEASPTPRCWDPGPHHWARLMDGSSSAGWEQSSRTRLQSNTDLLTWPDSRMTRSICVCGVVHADVCREAELIYSLWFCDDTDILLLISLLRLQPRAEDLQKCDILFWSPDGRCEPSAAADCDQSDWCICFHC